MARATKTKLKFSKSIVKQAPLTKCKRQSIYNTRSEGPTPALLELQFKLEIQTTNTSPQIGMLSNRFEEPNSKIVSLNAGPIETYDQSFDDFFILTHDDLSKPGYVGKHLVIESLLKTRDGRIYISTRRTYNNDKNFFTIAEIVDIIVNFERIDRKKTKWFGGIDCHHVYFEGLCLNRECNAFHISWGS